LAVGTIDVDDDPVAMFGIRRLKPIAIVVGVRLEDNPYFV
jgi:hypothetical protein